MIRGTLFAALLMGTALLSAAPPVLPKAVTSFGTAVCDGFVYVYGGHMGKAHEYSKATVSGALWRLSLAGPDAWEALPGYVPVQSPGIVAWSGKIYLVGGMQPENEPGAAERLLSLDEVAVFDPAQKTWEKLAPLPQPRSSHALAVLDGKLYAIGGWPLNIGGPPPKAGTPTPKKYHDTMAVLDLTRPASGWKTLPQPWQRRALAAVAFAGKIWCIGGMTEDNELSSAVDVYDPATQHWSTAPEVPEGGHAKAFGCAACVAGGMLIVSPEGGKLYRIGPDAKAWVECGKLAKSRYFHQLVALDATHLMALGGTAKGLPLDDVEIVALDQASSAELDWPQFHGPSHNNTTSETGWRKDWPQDGPPLSWKAKVGSGMASFAVVGDHVFTAGNDGHNQDTVFRIDLATGKPVWRHDYPCKTAAHEMSIVPPGPCATPCVSHGHVITISREGDVFCHDAATGAVVWQKNMIRDFHGHRPVYGYAGSPLVWQGKLFLDVGGQDGSTVCLDEDTGKTLWAKGTGEAGYSTPVIADFSDKKRLVMYKGRELVVLDPEDGHALASYETTTTDYCNCATPMVTAEGDIFISHTGGDGSTGLKFDGMTLTRSWNIRDLGLLYNSGVPWGKNALMVFNDSVRGSNDLRCLDLANGAVLWQSSEVDKGTAILSDGHLIVLSTKGEVLLCQPSDNGIKVQARAQVLDGRCWVLPVLSHHRLLCRSNAGDVVCLDLRQR